MLARRQQRQRVVIAGMTLVAIVLAALAISADILGPSLQNAVYDFTITSFPAKVKNQVTIVAIDDKTIDAYKQYPLPRNVYADLLSALRTPGRTPTVVAFDVGFYEPSGNNAADAALAAAIKASGNVVLAMQGPAGAGTRTEGAMRFSALQLPISAFRDGAAALGAVNVNADEDGRVRDAQMIIQGPQGERYYALPLVAVARHLASLKQSTGDEHGIRVEAGRMILPGRPPQVADRVMPLDRGGGMPVYYAAPPATPLRDQKGFCAVPGEYCVVSMTDVISGAVPAALLSNRLVFVGAHSVSAVPDDYPVPNSAGSKMYGVEIWANTAQSILTDRFPVRHQGFLTTLLGAAVLTLAGILLVTRFRLLGFFIGLGLLAVYAVLSIAVFAAQTSGDLGTGPVEVPSIGYVVPAVFWWVIALGYVLVEEQVTLQRTQSTFGRFVTPAIARTIMEREEAGSLALGGEAKQVTVLFGDIRGFTTMSEGMSPGQLLDTLNRYFDGMVDVVNKYNGTVNKYNGDNIMVLWGAPLEVPDHARNAVECALEIQRFIVTERAKGGPDVSFGFGINTGPVVAGFLGAKGRMEYTVIGDTANVASRLTSADIARRDQVAVSAATLAELGDDVTTVDLGEIAVKGRAGAVRCYQVDRLGALASPNPAPPPERPIGAAVVAGFH
ncbi:MAG: adenylate/guanylate cyclase domain-containing protein [Chloroflexi bacterium]|nr:adenylate/guanylate cyclase domain-containing protein [Chloroflexota bacterium]